LEVFGIPIIKHENEGGLSTSEPRLWLATH